MSDQAAPADVVYLDDRRTRTGLDIGQCGAFVDGGARCQGRVLVVGEEGGMLEGECVLCGSVACLPAHRADARIRQRVLFDRAGLPPAFAAKRFEERPENRQVLEAVRCWIASFPADGDLDARLAALLPAPFLWGMPGTGKSHLLAAICRKLIHEHELRVLFRPVRSLLRELQRFEDPNAREEAWNRAVRADVLALDDLGAEQATDWRQDVIADLVDERYQQQRPIVLTSNCSPSQWEALLDARTYDRLANRGMTFPVEVPPAAISEPEAS